eukprot:TRINITY_DN31462_c2_g1_i2.p1 TRINITY_DN31462_c2_g1~~TRINITY_DN31462_c2_g1_i2.p1  ORF type:complete len:204 (+),score=62.41 TRINITY_DN31462_c2_g1_i2:43-612(+)
MLRLLPLAPQPALLCRYPCTGRRRRRSATTGSVRRCAVSANTTEHSSAGAVRGGGQLLWDSCDTAKEIVREEAHEGAEHAEIKPEHYALAVRAFAYGSVLAVLGVTAITFAIGWCCGFRSVADALDWLRAQPQRQRERLKAEGHEVRVVEIDATNPGSWAAGWEAVKHELEQAQREQEEAREKADEAAA